MVVEYLITGEELDRLGDTDGHIQRNELVDKIKERGPVEEEKKSMPKSKPKKGNGIAKKLFGSKSKSRR